MPKIVTVHGTFAHIDASDDPVEHQMAGYRQWWESGSTFEARFLELVDAETDAAGHDEPISFHPFVWDGQNSERSRRNAGTRLLDELDELEGKNETYCIVGHSHGGSVIASALLQAADRGTELNGLRRWITIGTPFVELRRERFLFLRLPLLLKAMFVASLMLLFMYLFYVVGELLDGQRMITNENQLIRLAVSTILTALPFIAFYIVALIIDRRKLYLYRRRTRQQAQQQFEDKWVGLSHEDDEAVRGLGSLRTMRLQIFHRNFAVPILSLLSVFILPLVYLYVLMSPSLMVGIADYLKTNVYKIGNYSGQMRGVEDVLTSLRQKRRELQRAQRELGEFDLAPGRKLDLDATVRRLRNDQRNLRRGLTERYPNLTQIRRARRFERLFLTERTDGAQRRCSGGRLCGNGRNILLNAKLLFHLVTDEVAGWVTEQNVGGRLWSRLLRSALPILLVPIVFGIAAVVMVLFVQLLARSFSRLASRWLDKQTWFEIRRTALGNDTEGEVAVGTAPSPAWLEPRFAFLPQEVGRPVSEHSNRAMSASITKIRNAISEFALNEGRDGEIGTALNYLTWQELIHTSYFEVPEFRKLLARIVSDSDGFRASDTFTRDEAFAACGNWLRDLQAEKPSD